jgi:hypothetical protein
MRTSRVSAFAAVALVLVACSSTPLKGTPVASNDVCSPDAFCENDSPPPQAAIDLCNEYRQDPACGSLFTANSKCHIAGRRCTLEGKYDAQYEATICHAERDAYLQCVNKKKDGGAEAGSDPCGDAVAAICFLACTCGGIDKTGCSVWYPAPPGTDAGAADAGDGGPSTPPGTVKPYADSAACNADLRAANCGAQSTAGFSAEQCKKLPFKCIALPTGSAEVASASCGSAP